MSRESAVFIIGIILFLVPFLGIPQDVKSGITILSGIVLILLGIILRRATFLRSIENGKGERESDTFTESQIPEKIKTL